MCHRGRGWEYLKGLRLRRRTPRPQHQKSSEAEQQEWKKKLAIETVRVHKEYPDAEVQVWAMDEHRLGLKPVLRKVWVSEGEQPNAAVNWRFKWLWLYGACPSTIWRNQKSGFYLMSELTYLIESWPTLLNILVLAKTRGSYWYAICSATLTRTCRMAYQSASRSSKWHGPGVYTTLLTRIATSRTLVAFN